MLKKIGLLALAATMIFSMFPMNALAEDDNSRVVIGADLKDDQIVKVYGYFGINRSDVKELSVTNAEEHKYLAWLVSKEKLGTKSISCVYIKMLSEGEGVEVSTKNIELCTSEMYQGALLTAGIYDAKIIVAAPFDVSGTAGLLGIYKAYEDITGNSLDELAKNAGLQELFVTGSLSDFIGSESATYIISEIKKILDETQNMTDIELKEEILLIASTQNIAFTDANIEQIIDLSRTLEGLDVKEIQTRLFKLSQTFDKVKNTTDGIKSFFNSVGDFFAPVGIFFTKVGEWFSNLFGDGQ